MDDDGLGRALGIVTEVDHETLDRHTRLTSLVSFSRSATQALPAPTIGQQTDAVLREFGLSAERIAELRAKGVVL
jgi:formyl-CoA transferase